MTSLPGGVIEISVTEFFQGEDPVARSEARRLIERFEDFRTVVLDFQGVKSIGQGFADQLFRVFRLAHPATQLIPIHMQPDVEAMIKHVVPAPAYD